MEEPKIIFIPTPLKDPITGGENYELKLLEFLKERFRNVEPIEISTSRVRAKKSYQILFFGLTSLIRNFLYVFRIIKKKDNQRTVILEDNYYSTDLFLFNFLIRRMKKNVSIVPMVHHLYYSLRKQKFYQILLKAAEALFLNESDWIIANSEATEKDVKKLLKEAKTFLIAYPGVGKEKIASRKIDSYDLKKSRMLNILAVGSVTERKNYETLLKAVKILVDRCSEVNFFVNIIGNLEKDKEYPAKILETADALSLSNHVAFKVKVDNSKLRDFYARSDIFVSTSLHEGFGMAVAEAMCNHLPVVATNCGAVPYLVEDGVSGFLVPPRDFEQLADKIKLLLKSEVLRKKMGTKGFCRVKKFDWDRTFDKIYKKLLEPWTFCVH